MHRIREDGSLVVEHPLHQSFVFWMKAACPPDPACARSLSACGVPCPGDAAESPAARTFGDSGGSRYTYATGPLTFGASGDDAFQHVGQVRCAE